MHVKKSLMLWVAVLALALPMMLAGTASAKYMGDGAVQDGGTGGWTTPNDMMCIVGVHADGTLDIADGVTNARDCIYLQTGTMNGGTAFDLTGMTTSAACKNAGGTGNDGAAHAWATTYCSKSLKGLDRTQKMCEGIGGTWVTSGKCVAFGRAFKGQDASGTPLAIGTKGNTAAGSGFCYAKMRTGLADASCPSVVGSLFGTKTATSTEAFAYSAPTSTNCTYDFGINGVLDAALTKANGTTYAAGTSLDLSAVATQGDCLANGGKWEPWVPMGTSAVIGSITGVTFDLTRQAVNADEGCLHCHSTKTEYNGPAEREKDSYLKTGHKNMLRKVTAGNNYAGADGALYTAYAAGSLNFGTTGNNDATATVAGVAKPLLYLFGDWMAPAPAGLDVVVSMSGAAKYNGGSDYSCAACHTAGWSDTRATAGLCSASSKTNSATCTAAGGTWTPLSGVQAIGTPGYAAKQPGDPFGGITFGAAGQWDSDGITCGRCHNATVPSVSAAQIAASGFPATAPTSGGMGALAAGVTRNSLCFGCHQSMAKTNNGIGADADLANPTALIVKNTAVAPAYVPGFSGHVLGNSFLNSPHARFTGSVVPNSLGKYDLATNTAANYNSTFKGYTCWQSPTSNSPAKTNADGTEIKTKTECEGLYGAGSWRADTNVPADGANSIQGTCATCHDVHNSLFVTGQEGLRKECTTCHVDNAADYGLTAKTIAHPTGAGTPRELEATEPAEPCVICHMPKPTAGDFPMHVWRVNADASYSTFPTATEFGIGATATKKNANTAADDKGYANAVWVDLDLSCGQCHGTNGAAHLISKGALTTYAQAMHDGGSAPTTDCATCHAASQNGKVAIQASFGPGKNHHGAVPGETDCIACHTRPGTLPTGWNIGGAMGTGSGTQFCLNCHQNYPTAGALTPGVSHHAGACVTCHNPNDTVGAGGVTGPGVIPVVSNCLTCHPTKSMGAGTNHKQSTSSTPAKCQDCHVAGGFKPTAATCTSQCHNGTKAPVIDATTLSNYLVGMHVPKVPFVNHAPVALGLRDSYTGTTTLNATVVTNSSNSVGFTDRSTDVDNNVKAVSVNWGDSTPVSTMSTTGGSFSHSYTKAGTFTIIHTVTDLSGAGNTERATVKIVPPVVTVSGLVTNNVGKPLSMAKVTLKRGLTTRTAYTNYTGTYKFTRTLPGIWTITATKTGYTFSGSVTVNAPTESVAPTITAN